MSWSPRAGQPAPPAVPQRRPVYRPTLSPPVVIPASPGWWRTWWAPVLQLVALASITLTASAFAQHQSGVIAADVAADRGAGVRIALARKVIHAAAPVSVSIPALHARSSLIDLRRQPDGTLQVPKNPAQAGWYVGSSHPR